MTPRKQLAAFQAAALDLLRSTDQWDDATHELFETEKYETLEGVFNALIDLSDEVNDQ